MFIEEFTDHSLQDQWPHLFYCGANGFLANTNTAIRTQLMATRRLLPAANRSGISLRTGCYVLAFISLLSSL